MKITKLKLKAQIMHAVISSTGFSLQALQDVTNGMLLRSVITARYRKS